MKNLIIIGIALLILIGLSSSQKNIQQKTPNTLKLIWASEIGNLSYRSNIVIHDNSLFIGSNGSHFNDANILDETNGVYELNRKNGTVIKRLGNELFGDMDVNGILKFDNSIIFGNDNEELLCFDLNGEKKWRIPTSGDVEHKPTLISYGDKKVIVYATENGEISGVNPLNGKIIWSYYHPYFSGWKKDDNRNLFKVKMHFSSNNIYFDEPIIADVNNDGISDLLYYGNDDIICLNGLTGAKIWGQKIEIKDHELPLRRYPLNLSISKNSIQIHYVIRDYALKNIRLISLNNKGQKVNSKKVNLESLTNNYINNFLIDKNGIYDLLTGQFHPVSLCRNYTLSCSEKMFVYNNEPCIAIVEGNYFDYTTGVTYAATIKIVGLKTFKIHLMKNLEDNTEAVPQIADINKDGNLDVLIGCYNNKIYCYDLGIPVSKLID